MTGTPIAPIRPSCEAIRAETASMRCRVNPASSVIAGTTASDARSNCHVRELAAGIRFVDDAAPTALAPALTTTAPTSIGGPVTDKNAHDAAIYLQPFAA